VHLKCDLIHSVINKESKKSRYNNCYEKNINKTFWMKIHFSNSKKRERMKKAKPSANITWHKMRMTLGRWERRYINRVESRKNIFLRAIKILWWCNRRGKELRFQDNTPKRRMKKKGQRWLFIVFTTTCFYIRFV
jgi:hypothetical protein